MYNSMILLVAICVCVGIASGCSQEYMQNKMKSCQANAGLDVVLEGRGTVKIETACNDGRMATFVNCVKGVIIECGLSSIYDFDNMDSTMVRICDKAPELDAASSCMEGKTQDLTMCTTEMTERWMKYVKSGEGQNDVMKLTCSLVGGIKSCFKTEYAPCGSTAADVLVDLLNGFSPTGCRNYDSCLVCGAESCLACGAERTVKISGLLMLFVLAFKFLM